MGGAAGAGREVAGKAEQFALALWTRGLPVHRMSLPRAQVGPYLFSRAKPKDYSFLSEKADRNEKLPAPEHGELVGAEMRALLPYTPPWVLDPSYDRVSHSLHVLCFTCISRYLAMNGPSWADRLAWVERPCAVLGCWR